MDFFFISDHMDSSLPRKRKIRKRIVLYLNRVPNTHCMRSAEDLKNMAGVFFFFFSFYHQRTSRLKYNRTTTVFPKLELRENYIFSSNKL